MHCLQIRRHQTCAGSQWAVSARSGRHPLERAASRCRAQQKSAAHGAQLRQRHARVPTLRERHHPPNTLMDGARRLGPWSAVQAGPETGRQNAEPAPREHRPHPARGRPLWLLCLERHIRRIPIKHQRHLRGPCAPAASGAESGLTLQCASIRQPPPMSFGSWLHTGFVHGLAA